MDGMFNINFAIAKVDAEKRQVWGYATVEEPDKQGDVVDFDASVEAFKAWPGNIREQHNRQKAIGKCVAWTPVPERKAIWVGAQLSRSRDGEDAWTKVQEGVLKGFSIGGEKLELRPEIHKASGRTLNRITRYRLDELSLVDNPACPSAAIHLVKSANGVSMPTEAIEKQVSTTGEAPMDPPAATISQTGSSPSASGQVQTDTSKGERDPGDDDENHRDGLDPSSVEDTNQSVDAPSVPGMGAEKPNGLTDQRGKHIEASVDVDGLAKAVLAHLYEHNAVAVAKVTGVATGANVDAPKILAEPPAAQPVAAAPKLDIAALAKAVAAQLLPDMVRVAKGDPYATKDDSADDGKKADAADDQAEGDKPDDDDEAQKAAASQMTKASLASSDAVRTAVTAAVGSEMQKMTGFIEKALGDLLERSMGDIEARLSKSFSHTLDELKERVEHVEKMPAYPEGAPAVRAIDKALGSMPGATSTAQSNLLNKAERDVVDKVFRSTANTILREQAGYALALDEIKSTLNGR